MTALKVDGLIGQRRGPTLSAQIARQLHDAIVSGKYHPGDRLPSVNELARQLAVSVSSVREAISALAVLGIVEPRVGQGTFVREPKLDALPGWLGLPADPDELFDLIEVRRVLETACARFASIRATPDDREILRKRYNAMIEALDNPAEFAAADVAFHLEIARITGNAVLHRIMRAIQSLLSDEIRLNVDVAVASPGGLADSAARHGRLLEALLQGKSESAEAAVTAILDHAEEIARCRQERRSINHTVTR
jgi:GntR family transcriptional repressor for pyruvate dehydrogenase complex